jgi:hypothetical protein
MSEYGITISIRDLVNFLGLFLMIYSYIKVTKFKTIKDNIWWFLVMLLGMVFIRIVVIT